MFILLKKTPEQPKFLKCMENYHVSVYVAPTGIGSTGKTVIAELVNS